MHEGNGEGGEGPFGLHRDAWGRLVLTEPGGRQHIGVTPVRAFPISAPEQGLALCNVEGREVWWVESLGELPPQLRRLLEEDLGRRQFMPIILRVREISAPAEPSLWDVETDRGRTTFVLNSEDDVHCLEDHRALITDAHGVRYLIHDTRALDSASRRLLERFL
jgi:hypothetical protein